MKIGSSADLRAALNLSSSSQAGDIADISALFDQLLAQNVSAQASGSSPQENSATPPNENPPGAATQPYSASQQNFTQALLSAGQSPDAPANSNARPIPAEPRGMGFPRVAALVVDPSPAWPPSGGVGVRGAAAVPAAPTSAVPTEEIADIKQIVSGKTPAQPAGSATKTIAEILQSALAAPAPTPARAPSPAATAPAQVPSRSQPASAPATAPARPDVVMDAKSFARVAQFVMPYPPSAKQTLTTGAAPATSLAASPTVSPRATTNAASKSMEPLVRQIANQLQSDAFSQTDGAIPAAVVQTDVTADPRLIAPPQSAPQSSSNDDAKNVSVVAQFVASPERQSQATIAAPTQTHAAPQSAPAVTITDAIEGLRSALLGDVESVAPSVTIPATPKQSATAPFATTSPTQPDISAQAALPKPSDAKAAQQTIRFIAGIEARPVAQIAQSSRFAAIDTKNVATSAQSPIVALTTKQTPSTIIVPPDDVNAIPAALAKQSASAMQVPSNIATSQAPMHDVVDPKQMRPTQPIAQFIAAIDTKKVAAPASSAAIPVAKPTAAVAAVPTLTVADPKQAIHVSPTARFAAVIETKNVATPAQSELQTVLTKPLQTATPPQTSNVKPVISSLTAERTVAVAKSALQTPVDPVSTKSLPAVIMQTRDAKPEVFTQQAAEAKLTIPAEPVARVAVAEKANTFAATQPTAQTISMQPQAAALLAQGVKPVVSLPPAMQPSVDAKNVPQEMQTPDASPAHAEEQTSPAVPAQTRDAKQETPERPAASHDIAAVSKPETQVQPAPQPAIDTNIVVQPVMAAPIAATPQPSKAAPKNEPNIAARGSLAAAFAAAAAAKNIPLPVVQPDEPNSAPVAVSDKDTSDNKDAAQPEKNSDAPAQIAPAKNEPAAQAPVIFDNTIQTQPQAADNTIQLPQAAVTLTNNLGAAATQAPHASSNIDVSLQVGPKDHVPSAREPQVDLSTLAINIAARSQGGAKHFDIRLDPAEMGRVEVRLSIDESGKATAHLSAEKPQTLELLQRDSTTLERTLKDSGLDLSQNGLNFSLKGQNQQHNGSDAQPRGTPLVVTATANPEPSLNPINMRADNVRLDIHV